MKNVYADGMFVAYYDEADGGTGEKITMFFIRPNYEIDAGAEVKMKPEEKVDLKEVYELLVTRRHKMCLGVNDTFEMTPVTITWPDKKKLSAFKLDWEMMIDEGEDDGNVLIDCDGRCMEDYDWEEY